jgi:hypothetical protein
MNHEWNMRTSLTRKENKLKGVSSAESQTDLSMVPKLFTGYQVSTQENTIHVLRD